MEKKGYRISKIDIVHIALQSLVDNGLPK